MMLEQLIAETSREATERQACEALLSDAERSDLRALRTLLKEKDMVVQVLPFESVAECVLASSQGAGASAPLAAP
jgi:hypothetical protein